MYYPTVLGLPIDGADFGASGGAGSVVETTVVGGGVEGGGGTGSSIEIDIKTVLSKILFFQFINYYICFILLQ